MQKIYVKLRKSLKLTHLIVHMHCRGSELTADMFKLRTDFATKTHSFSLFL